MATSTTTSIIASIPAFFSALGITDFVDIAIAAFFMYLILIFIKQTRAYFIITTVVLLFGVNYLSTTFNLSLTRQIFQPLLTFVIVIVVVVFQREIRRFFEWFSAGSRRLAQERKAHVSEKMSVVIARALLQLAQQRIGAILVFVGDQPVDIVTAGGFPLDGRISTPLLLSIFDPSSPGHDGAVLIEDHRIRRFGVHLPLAEHYSHYHQRGTRHRAAAGITEKTDAIALVVSEEQGTIMLSEGGELREIKEQSELEKIIEDFLKESIEMPTSPWNDLVWKNFGTKLASIVVSLLLWFVFVYQTGVTTQQFSIPIEFRGLPKQYVIGSADQHELTVVLSGSYRDFINLDPNRDLKVAIDASTLSVGAERLKIGSDNVSYPSYFTLLSTSPKTVRVTVTPTATQETR